MKAPFNFATDPIYVVGCIDTYGAIHHKLARLGGDVMHGRNESKGRRFRWNILAQEFQGTLDSFRGGGHMSAEETKIVLDWLEKKGYRKP